MGLAAKYRRRVKSGALLVPTAFRENTDSVFFFSFFLFL